MVLNLLSGAPSGDPPGFDDPLWDDGKAEVCHYDAVTVIYGSPRQHLSTTVFVKEEFGLESKVKVDTEGKEPRITAIKAHTVEKVETDNYPYQRARTTIVARSNPGQLLRETASSQEWCGITSSRVIRSDGKLLHSWDSYFEGKPVGEESLPPEGVTDHQVMILARTLISGSERSFEFPLLSGIENNRGGPLKLRNAKLTSGSISDFISPAGTFRCSVVTLHADGDLWMTLWVEVAEPQRLIGLDRSDGHRLRLRESQRWAYWNRRSR